MSVGEKVKTFWSKNVVEVIKPLSASPAFMDEDEDEHDSDLDRGFNWSIEPGISTEPGAAQAQLAHLEELVREPIVWIPVTPPSDLETESNAPTLSLEVSAAAEPVKLEMTVTEPEVAEPVNSQPVARQQAATSESAPEFRLPVSFDSVVASDGIVDFDGLFRSASIPDVPITAEQGAWILNMLPLDLSLRVRRISARSSLEAISKFDSRAAKDSVSHIVSDAALKRMYVMELLKEMVAQAGAERNRIEGEIAHMEAEIASRRTVLADAEQNLGVAQEACRTRMTKFNDVIQFFDHADFARDGEALNLVDVDFPAVREAPLRMVAGAFK